ncbi:hypothetical protein P7K49_033771 [Saguinus oedipus]|uniref:Uncharacterized protein n=1 Tax=Saguinus oedipus TaxID=9490 RepID=A0ABQ9TTD1_SAGOE|nr:hypothetical protein P7K49_033771 [Saguinus oedipus]
MREATPSSPIGRLMGRYPPLSHDWINLQDPPPGRTLPSIRRTFIPSLSPSLTMLYPTADHIDLPGLQ